jgi:ribonucleoside-diphosphate reductase alpha chain
VVKLESKDVDAIPFQEASLDIWDKKYRLSAKDGTPVDKTMDDTYKRVARALADVENESVREQWYERFVWALRRGAIPAGRVTSNAGALEHKPATSTINCTVSGTIGDSMDDILNKVHEAGLTLKAGCVAPGTWVRTERGLVTADEAVNEQHREILSYDRETGSFEMRPILQHLTTHVPREENIRIVSNSVSLTTSIKHPVLVHRNDKLVYVRADEVHESDALVLHRHEWAADSGRWLEGWFAGAHLGDGSAHEKHHTYKPTRGAWAARARAYGRRFVIKISAAEREVVERYAEFMSEFAGARACVVAATTSNGTPVWDYSVTSFAASRVAMALIDGQTGEKSSKLRVPRWIVAEPERFFVPFLAGLIDTDGHVDTERGAASISMKSHEFAAQLQSLLGLFGVHGAVTKRKPRAHILNGVVVRDSGGASLKICDSEFLATIAAFMADTGKRRRLLNCGTQAGQYDVFQMPGALRVALSGQSASLAHFEKQQLGFYHGYHQQARVSRVWLNRWAMRFPALAPLIRFAMSLRPVESIERNLDLSETFFDFKVEKHNNYLAGNNGLAVIHNCGIGYEFSTLRPRGAYVSGAGAYTSGPLSFMDIYDKMCFTVSSAGGRRGAQMGTFDIGHPDTLEFIRAKRENGRLRQFNLSLLITDEFMAAVRADTDWQLAFPLLTQEFDAAEHKLDDKTQFVWREWPNTKNNYVTREDGLVCCKVYKTLPARRMWDVIMTSTYDFAEPGFILIDRVNEMNNNWWCENIRATNPCVTADTWVQTGEGPRQVAELIGKPFVARVDGVDHASSPEGFFRTGVKPLLNVRTAEGHSVRLTAAHRVRRVSTLTRFRLATEWCAAGDLAPGDKVLIQDHRRAATWTGPLSGKNWGNHEGYLMGLLVGDGTVSEERTELSVWARRAVGNSDMGVGGPNSVMAAALDAARRISDDFAGWHEVGNRGEFRLRLNAIADLARELGLRDGRNTVTPAIERTSSDFYRGFLRGLFDADGSVQGTQAKGVSVRLAQSDLPTLESVQRMLLRLGIASSIYHRPSQHELIITGANVASFAEAIDFADTVKRGRLHNLLGSYKRTLNRERYVATVETVRPDGIEDVYDVQIPGINEFDANGLHAHNCGEQPLPPYGSCLLGSVNLTRFVKNAFTDFAEFDWNEYREVVKVFTRMLDNVCEINGLPLEQQRNEIMRKRRHGMGFLGLGSTITCLGMKYGSEDSIKFTDDVSREMAVAGWEAALELAKEKGPAPIMKEEFTVTAEMLRKRPEMTKDGWKIGDLIPGRILHARYSRYMQRVAGTAPWLVDQLANVGARFTHHSSIAPTGTISLSLANNASNGIEPSFAHHYFRNVIRPGKKSKEKVDVFSFELLAYRELINPRAMPNSTSPAEQLPAYFTTADDITPKEHVDIQAAAQKWVDSSISKTANVPTDYKYESFKDIYLYAHEKDLKGCTTFRFNPEAFQGVLVKEDDLKNTTYVFTLEDGTEVSVKGDEEIEYDGEKHTAANLYDALKEGYYGKF